MMGKRAKWRKKRHNKKRQRKMQVSIPRVQVNRGEKAVSRNSAPTTANMRYGTQQSGQKQRNIETGESASKNSQDRQRGHILIDTKIPGRKKLKTLIWSIVSLTFITIVQAEVQITWTKIKASETINKFATSIKSLLGISNSDPDIAEAQEAKLQENSENQQRNPMQPSPDPDKKMRAQESDSTPVKMVKEDTNAISPDRQVMAVLRSEALLNLSEEAVRVELKSKNLFDKIINTNAGGFPNQFQAPVSQNNTHIIVDKSTGLVWQQHGSKTELPFKEIPSYLDSLNNLSYGGHSNWRLPTLEELMSLMERDKQGGLYIDPLFGSRQAWIWTCDRNPEGQHWYVRFDHGECSLSDLRSKFNKFHVRAVASPSSQ